MRELERYYRILELEPGASLEEVNQAYRDLAFIWHPDRIPQEKQRLQEKARRKLQELNEAREKLRSIKTHLKSKTTTYPSSELRDRPNSYAPYQEKSTPNTPHRNQAPSQKSDLSGQDFSHANLKGRDLSGRNLSYANLNGANLSDAFMHKIILRGADLSNANLFRANLLLADMKEVNLQGADLIGADLSGADLRGADLRGARIRSGDRLLVKLIGANLSGAIMPDGSIHE